MGCRSTLSICAEGYGRRLMMSLPKVLRLLDRWGNIDSLDSDEVTPLEIPKIRRDEYLVNLTPEGEEEDDSF
jgi:hypothetical protein